MEQTAVPLSLILHETSGNVLENFSRPDGQLEAQNTFSCLSCFTFDNPHSEVLRLSQMLSCVCSPAPPLQKLTPAFLL